MAEATEQARQTQAGAGRIHLSPPHMGELEKQYLIDAFDSNWIAPLGPHVDAFEREFGRRLGGMHAAALCSGTAALHLAMVMLGVGPDDEVIVPTFTFVATANPVLYQGARPVFIDSDPDTWNMSPALLADELSDCARRGKLPKAVVAVDIYGQCCDYDALQEICDCYDLPLVIDAAESLGATYKGRPAGSTGTMAAFSFNGNKIITTGGGGMLASTDEHWAARARFLATQARDPASHYEHSALGYNYRLSNLLAAVGRGQLRALDERVRQTRTVNAHYHRALGDVPGIGFMPIAPYGRPTHWLTCVTVDAKAFGATPEEVRRRLERMDVESRPLWKPLHTQPLFRGCRVRGGRVAEGLFARGLCLPSGSDLCAADLERVVQGVLSASSPMGRRVSLTPAAMSPERLQRVPGMGRRSA